MPQADVCSPRVALGTAEGEVVAIGIAPVTWEQDRD